MSEKNAKAQKLPARKGFGGAVTDAIEAVAKTYSPVAYRARGSQIDTQVDPERYRRNQTTDSNN
jgi:hypothetical protein